MGKWIAGYAALWVILTMLESNDSTEDFGSALAMLIAASVTASNAGKLQTNMKELMK